MVESIDDLIDEELMEALVLRITGKTIEEWMDRYNVELRRALMLATISRERVYTKIEMFGLYDDDGDIVRRGWKQILGLIGDDVRCVMTPVQYHELTEHERYRQTKARRTKKGATENIEITKAIRFQIARSVFDRRQVSLPDDNAA